jgi:hypothetical protein
MFDKFVGKKLKVVFRDGLQNKGVHGLLEKHDENFIFLTSGNSSVLISKKDVVSIIEKFKGVHL